MLDGADVFVGGGDGVGDAGGGGGVGDDDRKRELGSITPRQTGLET